jgi:hypothetical protein
MCIHMHVTAVTYNGWHSLTIHSVLHRWTAVTHNHKANQYSFSSQCANEFAQRPEAEMLINRAN